VQRKVLALIASGLSNDQIAERLVISPLAARAHVSWPLTRAGTELRSALRVVSRPMPALAASHD